MASPVVHFEICGKDEKALRAFYKKIFGWKIKKYPMPGGDEYFGVSTKKPGEPGFSGSWPHAESLGYARDSMAFNIFHAVYQRNL